MSNIILFDNHPLIAALTGWAIAQIVKVPLTYLRSRRWDWSLLLRAGGMPSSHSALVAGLAHSLGLIYGFDSAYYAISFTIAMVVIYDATGIRRQAGKHARIINQIVTDLAGGHPLKQEKLMEVLGHSPLEALVGTLLGLATAQVMWMIYWQ